MRRSVLDKTVFFLGEKQGMVVNYDCSSCYDRVGEFQMSVLERRKEILYAEGSVYKISKNDFTLKCEANDNNCYGG